MKISIIVPCYNEENTILDILNKLSLIKNSIRDVEVIVIDDGSIDKTNSILNENKNVGIFNWRLFRHKLPHQNIT